MRLALLNNVKLFDQQMLELLKNRRLQINFAILVGLTIIIFASVLYSLSSFTRHGEEITVPDFTGFYYEEIKSQAEFGKFRFEIIDSIYDAEKEKGSIVSQDPKAESKVKEGRNIYLTVVAVNPEMIEMPNVVDLSMRNAISILETYGLHINKLSYMPDIAKNAVVEQKYRGEKINPGTIIKKGVGIELVLGLGMDNTLIQVPIFIGMTRKQEINELHLASINIGEEHFELGDDTASVRIYRQSPTYSKNATVKMGQSIEFWYKSDKNFDFDQYLETIKLSDEEVLSSDSLSDAK